MHHPEVSYYAVRQGPVDIFVLDGDVPNRPDLIAEQKSWLTTQATSSTARWKLAVFHQPPLTSSFRAAASWMTWDERKLVDAILCGHDHFYERLDYFGTPLFITGAGGQAQLFSVDVSGRNLKPVPTDGPASDPAWSPLLP